MSSRILTENEISLLKKGLKFCPTPKFDKKELECDISRFCRQLRLEEKYFSENDDLSTDNIPLVRNKSKYNPPKCEDVFLEETISRLKKHPLPVKKKRSNLSYNQRKAQDTLAKDRSIIIKEGDKGGAVVVMDTEYYANKVKEMLSNEEFYIECNSEQDEQTFKLIFDLINREGDKLHEEEIDYLTNFSFKTSYFYGLPKIHKSSLITNAIKEQNSEYITVHCPDDLKFRPIVGGPNSVTQRLSHFLDIILKPLCSKVPSFVKDDFDFLTRLPKEVLPGSKLISFDVVSLYTNIPTDLGLKAVKFWLEKHPNTTDNRMNNKFILKALEIVLKRNVFYFDNKYYQQCKGTAMGTKVAPTYATLVLGYLEEILYRNIEKRNQMQAEYLRKNFIRFLDDCFIIWQSDKDIENFFRELNMLHPDIQYTMECSSVKLAFLDIYVQIENGKIVTDLYCKTTDSHNYLDFFSNHAKHIKLNIPFSLASRLISIVSDENTLSKHLENLIHYLRNQHYPREIIDHGIARAKKEGPIQLHTQEKLGSCNIIPFVSTYNPSNYNIFPIVRGSEDFLKNSERMKSILNKKKIINCKRQPKNLKRILCASKFDSEVRETSVTKCMQKRCKTCDIIIDCQSYTFKNGFHFKIKTDMNCTSKNVIYALICSKCSDFYIGQTGMELRKRMTLHRQQTRTEHLRYLTVNEHCHKCADDNFFVLPIYQMSNSDVLQRENKEMFFIQLMKPMLNSERDRTK